jgi:hypothetical protein
MRSQNVEWPRSHALQQGSCPCRSWVFTCAGCHDRRWPAVSGAYLRKPLSQLMRKSVDAYKVVVSATLHIEVMPCTREMVAKHREKRSSISSDGLFRARWYQPLWHTVWLPVPVREQPSDAGISVAYGRTSGGTIGFRVPQTCHCQ